MSIKPFSAIAIVALAGLATLSPESAQAQYGRGGDRVCVYEHADFRGWEQCYGPGESDKDLGNRRNGISSVRIEGRGEITLFEHPQYGGRDIKIDSDVRDLRRLGGWNDETDSLRVGGDSRDDRRWGDRRGDRDSNERVCVYEHANYGGASQCFDARDREPDLPTIGWNDRISSVRTFGPGRITVFEHNNFNGQRIVIDRDIADLTQMGWNDRISSLFLGEGRRRNRR